MEMKIWEKLGLFIKKHRALKDFLLFALVTCVFHYLYWNSHMDKWIFGSFTNDVFNFFTNIAFKGVVLFSKVFYNVEFEIISSSLRFFNANDNSTICTMSVVNSCSGIKQIFQLLMVFLILPGKLWKRAIYFLCASLVVLFFNIVRIFGLTGVLLYYPDKYQFIHDWVGRPFHYVVIFLIWVIWIEFFAYPKNHNLLNKEKQKKAN